MSKHSINKPEKKTFLIACNPLLNVYHLVEVEPNQVMTTGQPLMIKSESQEDLLSAVYESYELDDYDQFKSGTLRELSWSVAYDKNNVDKTIKILHKLIDHVKLTPIKHPDREEYALPWSNFIIDAIPDGPQKKAITKLHELTVSKGNSKTHQEMIEGGWV